MKKISIITSILLVVIVSLGVAGFTYAQTQDPPEPASPGFGSMMPWGRNSLHSNMGNRPGIYGRYSQEVSTFEEGPMHGTMLRVFSEYLGISEDELETSLTEGKTIWQIASEQGLTIEQFIEKMQEARSLALGEAIENGIITQEQAQYMQQHREELQNNGFGPGTGNCAGLGHWGKGRHWNYQNTP